MSDAAENSRPLQKEDLLTLHERLLIAARLVKRYEALTGEILAYFRYQANRRSDERAILEWLQAKGGLGLEVHERIGKVLNRPSGDPAPCPHDEVIQYDLPRGTVCKRCATHLPERRTVEGTFTPDVGDTRRIILEQGKQPQQCPTIQCSDDAENQNAACCVS